VLIGQGPSASLFCHGCKKLSEHSALNQTKREASFTLMDYSVLVIPRSGEVSYPIGDARSHVKAIRLKRAGIPPFPSVNTVRNRWGFPQTGGNPDRGQAQV